MRLARGLMEFDLSKLSSKTLRAAFTSRLVSNLVTGRSITTEGLSKATLFTRASSNCFTRGDVGVVGDGEFISVSFLFSTGLTLLGLSDTSGIGIMRLDFVGLSLVLLGSVGSCFDGSFCVSADRRSPVDSAICDLKNAHKGEKF